MLRLSIRTGVMKYQKIKHKTGCDVMTTKTKISAKRPESIIESYFINQVKKHKCLQFKFLSGITGVPDRILIINKQIVFVELKAENGILSKRQTLIIKQLRRHGVVVFIPYSKTDIDDMFITLTQRKTEQI